MDKTVSEGCSVCGNNDTTLVDGYYYCVECGTQDTNIQETMIEKTVLADGTVQLGQVKKIHKVLKKGIEMSGEWYKWHTFNFILLGLVEELLALGAAPSVKMKVLWIWSRYVKLFQNKDALGLLSTTLEDTHIDDSDLKKECAEDEDVNSTKRKQLGRDIKYVTKSLLLAILYIALNMDKSDIQLYHLLRYVREKRLSLLNCSKFAPKEINVKKVPDWIRFEVCRKDVDMLLVQRISIALIRKLDLGPPLVPDLRKLIDNFMADLCLPGDLKSLVFSLMQFIPCDFLDKNRYCVEKLKKLPQYEVVAMSYVVVAMKMCFGLDCDYELRLSDAVDEINVHEDRPKSHKLAMSSNPTDRLFSFRDWCKFMQFRKMILCENYLPMALAHGQEIDDCVFMEQSEDRKRAKSKLSDEVTMDILNKLPLEEGSAIPKAEFPPTLTPLATYTSVIVQYYQDAELKLLLSEDFTQYSLKYACQDLCMPLRFENNVNIVIGVNESNKTVNNNIVGTLSSKKADMSDVFVRNCDNKNWLKTNPPQAEHVSKVESGSDKESDLGYDSPTDTDINSLLNAAEVECDYVKDVTKEFETIREEEEGRSIFDDAFDDIVEEDKPEVDESSPNERFIFEPTNDITIHPENYSANDDTATETNRRPLFPPENFDREDVIKELIMLACKNIKAPVPVEYKPKLERIKRPRERTFDSDGPPVKRRSALGDAKREMDLIMSKYYTRLENDIFTKLSEQVKSALETFDNNITVNSEGQVEREAPYNPEVDVNRDPNAADDTENNSVAEASVKDGSEASEDEWLDPRFDETTHDVKQLYVKIKNAENVKNMFDIEEDPTILDVIDKNIDEFGRVEVSQNEQEAEKKEEEEKSDSESDDEIPLSVIKNKMDENKFVLDNLVTNEIVPEFKYWLRHYRTDAFVKNVRMSSKFDVELRENFPESFVFVMQECTSVLGCSAFSLYKSVQKLEKLIVTKLKKLS